MAKFVLMFNKQVIQEFPLQKGSITIGRSQENDITIDNLAVSAFHARVDKTGPDFILTDLQSTNGTFVNDKKIVSHKLSHGDNIIIGKHTLLFLAPEVQTEASDPDSASLDLNKTMMLDTERQRELLAKQEKLSPPPKEPEKIGVLSFLDGSKLGEVELRKKLTRIGKASTSEVRLSGLFMGSTAATISRRPSGYTITFTGGLTKLKVNGEVVKGSLPLKDFDTIELGSYKFQFYQKEIQ